MTQILIYNTVPDDPSGPRSQLRKACSKVNHDYCGGGLGLLPERPRSTLTAFLRIKNDVPKTTENR